MRHNLKYIIALGLLIMLFSTISHAQGPTIGFAEPPIFSPNAASLGKFSDIPVDLSTGMANVSIPLYEMKEGQLSIPISLSYHASGFKPNQYPSWVGMGFNLFAGGAITRIVKGMEDEHDNKGANVDFSFNLGYFFNTDKLSNSNWYSYGYGTGGIAGLADTEPDEFSFSFNGYTGKFYLDHNKKWQVCSEHEIKVIFDEDTDLVDIEKDALFGVKHGRVGNLFWKFTLITQNGTKYVFGGERNAIEFTRPPSETGREIPIANTWNLTQIIAPNGIDVINFNYSRVKEDMILNLYRFNSLSINDLHNENEEWELGCYTSGGMASLSGSVTEPSYLSSIIGKNHEIHFNFSLADCLPIDKGGFSLRGTIIDKYDDIAMRDKFSGYQLLQYHEGDYSPFKKLNTIEVFDKSDLVNPVQTINLSYSENTNERLKLTGVVINGGDDNQEYTFEYYPNSVTPIPYLTEQTDHWGFFNNQDPIMPDFLTVSRIDFFADPSYATNYFNSRNPTNTSSIYNQEMLKRIYYPTRGFREFTYEPHNYSEQVVRVPKFEDGEITRVSRLNVESVGSDKICGGVRMKSITSSEGIIKKYYYVKKFEVDDAETKLLAKESSGQLQSKVTYLKEGNYICDFIKIGKFKYFSHNSLLSLFSNNGSHILYSEVTEVANDTGHGATCYFYGLPEKDGTDYYDELPFKSLNYSYFLELTNKSLVRGNIIKKLILSASGDPVQENTYEYNDIASRLTKRIRTQSYKNDVFCVSYNGPNFAGGVSLETGAANYIYYFNNYVKRITEKNYFKDGNYVQRTINYNYGEEFDKLLTQKIEVNSKGDLLKTTYAYGMNVVLVPIDEYRKSRYAQCVADRIDCIHDEEECRQKCRDIFSNPEDRSACWENICIECPPPCVEEDFANELPVLNSSSEAVYKMLNNHNIQPLEVLHYNNNNIIGGEINKFKYFNSTQPELSSILTLNIVEPINKADFNPISYDASTGTFSYDPIYELETIIDEYDHYGNLLQYHKVNDLNKSYIWGYNDCYPIITAENIDITNLKIAVNLIQSDMDSFLKNTIGDLTTSVQKSAWNTFNSSLRNHASLNKVFIKTYTYKPLIGITSETDPSGHTIYYEYDNFGRLSCIKNQDGNIIKTHKYNNAQ